MKAASIVLAGFATGCSLLVAVDGLSGSPNVPVITDAEAPARATPPQVETQDAARLDVRDATTVADAQSAFCPQLGAVFCADFEDDVALPLPFKQIYVKGAAVVALTTDRSKGARALRVETIGSVSDRPFAWASAPIVNAIHIHASLDMYIELRGSNAAPFWLVMSDRHLFYAPSNDDLSRFVEETYTDDGTAVTSTATSGQPMKTSRWAHLDLYVDLPTRLAVANVDGVEVVRHVLDPAWTSLSGGEFKIGNSGSSQSRVYYDNIALFVR